MRRRHQRSTSSRKGTFNPSDEQNVKHTRIGVWDLYEEVLPQFTNFPGASRFSRYFQMANDMPYIWRMIKDIGSIRACWFLLTFYLVVELFASLVPAVSLWYSGQLLKIVRHSLYCATNPHTPNSGAKCHRPADCGSPPPSQSRRREIHLFNSHSNLELHQAPPRNPTQRTHKALLFHPHLPCNGTSRCSYI